MERAFQIKLRFTEIPKKLGPTTILRREDSGHDLTVTTETRKLMEVVSGGKGQVAACARMQREKFAALANQTGLHRWPAKKLCPARVAT